MRAYCTAQEVQQFPLGLDLQNLVVGGSAAEQTAQLTLLTQQASLYVETITLQPLYAVAQTELQFVRPQLSGNLQVRVGHYPVAAVTSVQWRFGSQAPWQTVPIQNVTVEAPRTLILDDQDYSRYAALAQPKLTVQTQYVSGYPNAALAASVAAGATVLTVDDATGVAAGVVLTVYDIVGGQEQVTVASVSGNSLTLTAGVQYAHAAGVRVSALPLAVNLASIYIVSWLVKERRAGGGVMMGGKVQPQDAASGEDMEMARQLLRPYTVVI